MELEGLDADPANTLDRYIHGTNAESQLGTPSNEGGVRLSNLETSDRDDRVAVGTEVGIEA